MQLSNCLHCFWQINWERMFPIMRWSWHIVFLVSLLFGHKLCVKPKIHKKLSNRTLENILHIKSLWVTLMNINTYQRRSKIGSRCQDWISYYFHSVQSNSWIRECTMPFQLRAHQSQKLVAYNLLKFRTCLAQWNFLLYIRPSHPHKSLSWRIMIEIC